jgi:hypothetical protein
MLDTLNIPKEFQEAFSACRRRTVMPRWNGKMRQEKNQRNKTQGQTNINAPVPNIQKNLDSHFSSSENKRLPMFNVLKNHILILYYSWKICMQYWSNKILVFFKEKCKKSQFTNKLDSPSIHFHMWMNTLKINLSTP